MRRLLFILPVMLFAILVGFFSVQLYRVTHSDNPEALPSALINQPAPDFTLAGLGDKPGLARADLAGKVVLVNFFASWCVPCRAEQPLLIRLSKDLNTPLYGIDYKDKPDAAAQFLDELGNPYSQIGADRDGRVAIDFGVYGVPETFVIDKIGHIRLRYAGPLTPEEVQSEIAPLIESLNRS